MRCSDILGFNNFDNCVSQRPHPDGSLQNNWLRVTRASIQYQAPGMFQCEKYALRKAPLIIRGCSTYGKTNWRALSINLSLLPSGSPCDTAVTPKIPQLKAPTGSGHVAKCRVIVWLRDHGDANRVIVYVVMSFESFSFRF